jgi:methanogenic corrinoid protein MtbC1
MKVKDIIELLEEENPKAKIIFEINGAEVEIDEWNIESSDDLVTIKFIDK